MTMSSSTVLYVFLIGLCVISVYVNGNGMSVYVVNIISVMRKIS